MTFQAEVGLPLHQVQRDYVLATLIHAGGNRTHAAAMLGISKYKSRDELVAESSTGIVKEYDAATMARFETGHANEASARLIAMEMLDIDLLPNISILTLCGLQLSDSTPLLAANTFWLHLPYSSGFQVCRLQ